MGPAEILYHKMFKVYVPVKMLAKQTKCLSQGKFGIVGKFFPGNVGRFPAVAKIGRKKEEETKTERKVQFCRLGKGELEKIIPQ